LWIRFFSGIHSRAATKNAASRMAKAMQLSARHFPPLPFLHFSASVQ
jgi:hypothetical protein